MAEPVGVDPRDAVAAREDQVHGRAPGSALASQCGNGTLVAKPESPSALSVRSRSDWAMNRSRSLVGADHARVLREGEGAADQELDAALVQHAQRRRTRGFMCIARRERS